VATQVLAMLLLGLSCQGNKRIFTQVFFFGKKKPNIKIVEKLCIYACLFMRLYTMGLYFFFIIVIMI